MKAAHQLIQEDKVTFMGNYIPNMVFVNNSVTDAIEHICQTGQVYLENLDMLHRVKEFLKLLGYEYEQMNYEEDGGFYYLEIV